MTMKEVLAEMSDSRHVNSAVLKSGFEHLLDPNTSEEEIEKFLPLLSRQELNSDLLVTAVEVMRSRMIPVDLQGISAIDTCGTGGDKSGSFNLSTAAGLLLAAMEVPVAKHGNRALTSKAGSADLLEALGIPIDLDATAVAKSVQKKKFGFMLAPRFHPAAARVQAVRRRLDVVTVFNLIGPLLNPAQVKKQIVGIFASHLRPMMAEAFHKLGCEEVWVINSMDGLDELSVAAKTYISVATPQGVEERVFEPEQAGLRRTELKYLKGGDAIHNAQLLRGIFSRTFWGPLRDAVLLNAAGGLMVAGRAKTWKEGLSMGKLAIESGAAAAKLEELSQGFSNL